MKDNQSYRIKILEKKKYNVRIVPHEIKKEETM